MPRIAIHQTTTYHWSFDEDLAGLRECGARGVGIWRKKFADFGEERALLMLRESGLEVSSFGWAGGFTGYDGSTFDEALADAAEALSWAQQCRANCLCVVSGPRGGHTRRHAGRLVAEALTTLGRQAARHATQVALQPAASAEDDRSSFLVAVDDALDVVGRCGHPYVGMCLDLGRLAREEGWEKRVGALIPSVKLVTVQPCQCATAPVCWPSLIKPLQAAGYRGWYEVQARCRKCWQSDYRAQLAEMLSVLGARVHQHAVPAREPAEKLPAAAPAVLPGGGPL